MPAYNSCRNRHCPKCQALPQARWIEKRRERIIPTKYFHVVFTLPQELRALARVNPIQMYDLVLESAARTLLDFGQSRLHAQPGVTCVLRGSASPRSPASIWESTLCIALKTRRSPTSVCWNAHRSPKRRHQLPMDLSLISCDPAFQQTTGSTDEGMASKTRRLLTWLEAAIAIGFCALALWFAWDFIMHGGYTLVTIFASLMGAIAFATGSVGLRWRGSIGWLIQLVPGAFTILLVWAALGLL
jgi:hypothetical protein